MAICEKKSNFVSPFIMGVVLFEKRNNNDMQTITQNEYTAPEVKFVEVIVEKGFLISGIIINERFENEKHIVDEVEEW